MSQLTQRVASLEAKLPLSSGGKRVLIRTIVGADGQEKGLHSVRVIGGDLFKPRDGETDEQLLRRAHAARQLVEEGAKP